MTACTPATTVYGNAVDLNCLPNTGLDLWIIVLVALVLVAAGYAMRRYSNRYTGPPQA